MDWLDECFPEPPMQARGTRGRHPMLNLVQPLPEAGTNWWESRFVKGGTIAAAPRAPSPPSSESDDEDAPAKGPSRYDIMAALLLALETEDATPVAVEGEAVNVLALGLNELTGHCGRTKLLLRWAFSTDDAGLIGCSCIATNEGETVNEVTIGTSLGHETKNIAKRHAGWSAMQHERVRPSLVTYLQEQCGRWANRDTVERVAKETLTEYDAGTAGALYQSIGHRIMVKTMGWGGGDLGANPSETSTASAAFCHLQGGRDGTAGLGWSDTAIRRDTLTQRLLDFAIQTEPPELVFSNELSKEDRVKVHEVCRQNHLVSRSFGKGNNRYITVRRKPGPPPPARNQSGRGGGRGGRGASSYGGFSHNVPPPSADQMARNSNYRGRNSNHRGRGGGGPHHQSGGGYGRNNNQNRRNNNNYSSRHAPPVSVQYFSPIG